VAGFALGMNTRGFDVARRRFQNAVQSVEGRQWIAVKNAALFAEREIKLGLKKSAPGGVPLKPLSPITKLLRKGTKPLITPGASLFGSITTTLDKRNKAAFVGVHRTRRGADGEDPVNIAIAHEFGTKPFVIAVTAKMRKLFLFLFIKTGGTIKPIGANKRTIIHPGVPKRPFIKPTVDAIRPQLQRIIVKAFIVGGGPI